MPDAPQSLYQDDRGRIWVSTRRDLPISPTAGSLASKACLAEVHYIAGDSAGNLWLSEQGIFCT